MGAKKTYKSSSSFHSSHAKVSSNNVELGSLLGKGTFASVYSAHLFPEGKSSRNESTNDASQYVQADSSVDTIVNLDNEMSTTSKSSLCSSSTEQNGDSEPTISSISTHQRCALKTVRSSICRSQRAISARDLCEEAKILKSLPDHENIIKMLGVSENLALHTGEEEEEDKNNDVGTGRKKKKNYGWFLILERLDGTLQQRLLCWSMESESRKLVDISYTMSWLCLPRRKNAMQLAEQEQGLKQDQLERLSVCALGIAKAMRHLHQHRIIHHDLKPANIGFSFDNEVRLFDFGLATKLKRGQNSHISDFVGSPKYMSAEMLAGTGRCCFATDVWSYAIVLWEVCSLERPFNEFSKLDELRDAVVYLYERPPTKGVIAVPEIRSLVEQCWAKEPIRRPTFSKIVTMLEPLLAKEASCLSVKE